MAVGCMLYSGGVRVGGGCSGDSDGGDNGDNGWLPRANLSPSILDHKLHIVILFPLETQNITNRLFLLRSQLHLDKTNWQVKGVTLCPIFVL